MERSHQHKPGRSRRVRSVRAALDSARGKWCKTAPSTGSVHILRTSQSRRRDASNSPMPLSLLLSLSLSLSLSLCQGTGKYILDRSIW